MQVCNSTQANRHIATHFIPSALCAHTKNKSVVARTAAAKTVWFFVLLSRYVMAWPPEANEDILAMRECKSRHSNLKKRQEPISGSIISVCEECGWEVFPSEQIKESRPRRRFSTR